MYVLPSPRSFDLHAAQCRTCTGDLPKGGNVCLDAGIDVWPSAYHKTKVIADAWRWGSGCRSGDPAATTGSCRSCGYVGLKLMRRRSSKYLREPRWCRCVACSRYCCEAKLVPIRVTLANRWLSRASISDSCHLFYCSSPAISSIRLSRSGRMIGFISPLCLIRSCCSFF